jgi:hypothetical protein
LSDRETYPDRLSAWEPTTWLVVALALGLLLIGILFIRAPRLGAAIFGLPAPEGTALLYLPAIGLRDIAFGLFILALVRLASRRAVGVVLGLAVLIPVGDLVLVVIARGLSSPGHLLIHAASGALLAAASFLLLQHGQSHDRSDVP